MEDEKRVSSSLILSPDTSPTEPLSPVPRSPSPAPDSEPSEDEAERDWLTSPLAYKVRQLVHRQRTKLIKRRAAAVLADGRMAKKGKKWHNSSEKEALTVESLESLARQMGYKVVPASPKGASDGSENANHAFQIPGPVKEVAYESPFPKGSLSSPNEIDALLAGPSGSLKAQAPQRKRVRHNPDASDSSDVEKPAPKQGRTLERAPTRPQESRSQRKCSSVRVVRERYQGRIPKSKNKHVAKSMIRRVRVAAPQPTVAPKSATSANVATSRPRFLRRKLRRSLRPVVLHRSLERKTLSGFHTVDVTSDVRAIPGHEFVRVYAAMAVHRRVRNGMLHRHRVRTGHTKAKSHTPHSRPGSFSAEDEEVDMLLESDVEMLDNEEIEATLVNSSASNEPKLNAARKRPPRRTGEAAERFGRRATLRADEVAAQAERLKEFFSQCAEERRAAKERKETLKRAAIEWLIAERERERERAETAEAARVEAEIAAAAAAAAEAELEREAREVATAEAYAEERAQLAARVRVRHARLNHVLRRERMPSAPGFIAPGRRMRAATTPIRTFQDDEANDSVEHSRPMEIDCVTGRRETEVLNSEDEEMNTIPAESAPRTPSPCPQELPLDSPPTYEFPFFPIIRAAPAPTTPLRARQPIRRRASDPPVYVQLRERTDRSPSPPPPYNAETDAQTVIPPVFHPDREQVEADLVPSTSPQAQLRVRLASPVSPSPAPRRTLPGHLPRAEYETVGASVVPSAEEQGDPSSEEEQQSTPIVRTIGRWFGLW